MIAEKDNTLQLDKSAIREFAVNARRKLKERVELQANKMGFFSDDREINYEFEDENQVKINGEFYNKKQIKILNDEISSKTFDIVIDEAAYTWFNRFIALYYMEYHNYIDNGLKVIQSIDDLNQTAIKSANILKNIDKESLFKSVQDNNSDEVYKKLVIAQCNELNEKLPFLFEEISNYTELLFPSGMMNNDSVIREMLALDKSNWDEVEIIGWLYQYYIAEKKDEVFADLKKGNKITKENVPAATQIFTPKWIVRYMVENSVGKLWLDAHPNQNLQAKFKYYLESAEQEEDVKQRLEEIINKSIRPDEIKVLDPACGSGHILVTAFETLYEIYKSAGYLEDEIAPIILQNNLFGLDICDRAAQLAQFAVIMKAQEYDTNITNKVKELNITSIQESNWIDERVKECLINSVENKILAASQIDLLIDTFRDAKEYGSIIDVKDFDFNFWEERLNAIQTLNMGLLYSDVVSELQRKLPQLIKQAKIMQQQYECVIANPPYMGNKGMSAKLTEFVKNNYPMSKGDMFAVFKEVILNHTKRNYYSATVNQHSWMFLSSYEQLREHLLNNAVIDTMAHLGTRAFEEIGGDVVQTTTYITKKINLMNFNGKYIKLTNYPNAQLKEEKFLEFDNNDTFSTKQCDFNSIPSSPIAYWASDKIRAVFREENKLINISDVKQGMSTADNDRFLRFWFEPNINKLGFNYKSRESAKASKLKWVPYNKGGEYRRWYGNNEYVVNWENDGLELKNFSGSVIRNPEYFYQEGIEWSTISGRSSFRFMENGFILGGGSSAIYNTDLNYICGLVNSPIIAEILSFLSPTINFSNGVIAQIPIKQIEDNDINKIINDKVNINISISKDDWDSFETSWDFTKHPLLKFGVSINSGMGDSSVANPVNIGKKEINLLYEKGTPINVKIQNAFEMWKNYKESQFNKLKANEEELNHLFIEIYGLQDEMNSTVEDKDITVALADEKREIKSLLSYAVGCMFGRYSLDKEGLVFAGGTFDSSKYKTLEVDEDGIIPILSDTWFEDDIIEELKRFLKAAFGEIYLSENMEYIADVLGRKNGESAENTIRNYFLKDFYKDHLQVYKKRPIYWMFTSGKKKAFNCLVYLHRYDKATLSRIRKDYLHEFQAKLDRAISQAEDEGNVKLTSLYAKYKSELLDFDAKIKDLADSQIELDLDEGVKVNYAKFKGLLEAEKEVIGKEK